MSDHLCLRHRPRGDIHRRLIGTLEIHVLRRREAISLILDGIGTRRPQLVAFANAHTVNLAARDEAYARVLNDALLLNDGVGVDIASRVLHGEPFPQNLCGTDLIPMLLDAAETPLRIFLLGSAPGTAERAGTELNRRYGHLIVGTHHGFFAGTDEEGVADSIAQADPDLVLVGMGQPRQEIWARRYFERFSGATICVGAFLDFTAGVFPRAPAWLQRWRLEWAYRLYREPRRLAGRYMIGNVQFLARLMRDVARK